VKPNQATPKEKSEGIKYKWKAPAKDATFYVYQAKNSSKGKYVSFRMLDNGKMAGFTQKWNNDLKSALKTLDIDIKRWEMSDRRFNKYEERMDDLFKLIQTKSGVNQVVKMLKKKENKAMAQKSAQRLLDNWKELRTNREEAEKILQYAL
jgi:hypothetical protein